MRKLWLALVFLSLGLAPAQPQTFTMPPPAGVNVAAGVYNSSPPILVTGTAGMIQLDSAGNLRVVSSGTPSGTQNVDIPAVEGPVAPGTATATKAVLGGCQATSAAITPTTGQQAAVDCDLNNNLLVSSGGAPNLAIAQVSIATTDTLAIAARALRRSVTIQQITGTQNVFCNQTTATAANGVVLPAQVGASFTFNTTSAIRCIAITGAQTVAVAETF